MTRNVDSDKLWEEAQKKVFRAWVNMHLETKSLRIRDLAADFADGVKLIALLEVLNKKPIEGRYYKNPKSRPYRIDNVNFALNFIRTDLGVKLIGCSAEDIVDGNIKMVLGLLWRLIQKYQIGADNSRKELLTWCQESVSTYGLSVENLLTSFRDGLVFSALVHKYDNSLLNFEGLNKEEQLSNLTKAFDLAREHLKVAKLLDPRDVHDGSLDERSIMTYLSLWHRAYTEKFGAQKPGAAAASSTSASASAAGTHAAVASPAPAVVPVAAAAAPAAAEPAAPAVDTATAQKLQASLKELEEAQKELERLRKENDGLRGDLGKLSDELKTLKETPAPAPAPAPVQEPKPAPVEEPKPQEPPKAAEPAAAAAEPVVVHLSDEEKSKYEAEIKQLQEKIKELEAKLDEAKKASEQAQKELEETKEEFTSLQKKAKKDVEKESKKQQKKLEKSLKAKDKEAEELKKQLDSEIEKRDTEIKALKAKLKKAKKDVAEGQQASTATPVPSAVEKDVEEVKKELEELLQLAHMFESEETSASRKEFQQKQSKEDLEATEDK